MQRGSRLHTINNLANISEDGSEERTIISLSSGAIDTCGYAWLCRLTCNLACSHYSQGVIRSELREFQH